MKIPPPPIIKPSTTFTQATIQSILDNDDAHALENLVQQSAKITRQQFGRTISLYTPLYLSNYCSSHCTYCGFSRHNKIQRIRLNASQIQQEMRHISKMGIKSLLLLTGESYKATPTSYLQEAIRIAKKYFPHIALEVHPMDTQDYQDLFQAGADGITIYQETYHQKRYAQVHVSGKKRDYAYRRDTPRRAAEAGVRHISMGILLGLAPLAEDLYALYQHLQEMERQYPGVEYSLSFPRLRTIKGIAFAESSIDNKTFLKVICLTRLLFPRIGLNLSTRESATLRDHLLECGITRISAGSNTSVGGYSTKTKDHHNPQFDIEDKRPVKEIIHWLKTRQFDPILTDWRAISN